jgi:hypothetical protein
MNQTFFSNTPFTVYQTGRYLVIADAARHFLIPTVRVQFSFSANCVEIVALVDDGGHLKFMLSYAEFQMQNGTPWGNSSASASTAWYQHVQATASGGAAANSDPATGARQDTALTALTNLNTALGTPPDASATTDSGTFGLIALLKRLLGKFSTSASGLLVDGSGVTQPVSASALPLPTGAATSANQATELASLASLDGKLPANPATDRPTAAAPGAARLSDGNGFYDARQVRTLTAADQVTVANPVIDPATGAKQDTANASLSSLTTALGAPPDASAASDSGTFSLIALLKRLLGKFPVGQSTMANARPVVIASDQTNVPVLLKNEEISTSGSIVAATSLVQATVSTGNQVAIQLAGTYAGVNATFEVSNDGIAWALLQVTNSATGAITTATGALAANATVIYNGYCGGAQFIRVRATAWTSGTASVLIRGLAVGSPTTITTQPSGTQTVTVGSALPTGTNSIGTVVTQPMRAAIAQINATITTGGTAQTALAALATRNGFEIFNTSPATLWLNIGGTAALNVGIPIQPGGAYSSPSAFVSTSAVSIIGATTGQTFTTISY